MKQNSYAIKFFIILINFIIGAFFPAFSFLVYIITFSFLKRNEKSLFLITIFSLSFFAAITYSSRAFLLTESDDYIRYYQSYLNITKTSGPIYFEEPGLFWFYKLLNYIEPNLTVSGLSFITLFISLLLLGFLFYNLCFYTIKLRYIGVCFTFLYLLISVDYMNQLVRQSISLILITFIFLNIKYIAKVFLFFIAAIFHFSSIPIFLLLYTIRNFSIKYILISFICVAFLILIIYNIPYLDGYFNRLEHYKFDLKNIELNWYIKYIFLIIFFSLMFKTNKENEIWKKTLVILSILVILSLPFGLLSLRLFSLYIIFFLGLHFYLTLENKKLIIPPIIISLFLLKSYNLLIHDDSYNSFALWHTYDRCSDVPFYYFSEYIQ